MLTRLFDGAVRWDAAVLATAATLIVAYAGARLARRLAASGLRAVVRDTLTPSSPLFRAPLRLVGSGVFLLLVGLLLFPAFQLAGLRPRTGIPLRTLAAWTFASGLRIVLIALVAYALIRVTALLVRRFEHDVSAGTDRDAVERGKRARTLGGVINKVAQAVIITIAALMILREFQLDIAPVLTGAGILGLAVGFGAQTLVRDIISGFFLILEDQVRVGDTAAINGIAGTVEALNLRTIVLRDIEGTVHIYPNGAITTLANRSKDFAYYVIDVAIAYREDPDRVADLLRAAAEELQADPRFGPFILEPLEVLGVDSFTDWAVTMKIRLKTVPMKQLEIGRELRRRIRKAFDEHGIDVPYPARPPAGVISAPSPPEQS